MPQISPSKSFDYSSLDAETNQFVQQQTREIRLLMRRTAQDICEIGQKLIEVKKRLGHGRFLDWLSAEFAWTERTAQRFMSVAEKFGSQSDMMSDLDFAPSALYTLAAPSTPETARVEAMTRATAGETITPKLAEEIKHKHTQPPTQASSTARPRTRESRSSSAEVTPSEKPRHRAVKQELMGSEIIAIRPFKAVQETTAPAPEKIKPLPPSSPTPKQVLPGFWWQLGQKHLLYCGAPSSPRFKERLPQKIALTVAFPLTPDWHLDVSASVNSSLAFYTCYRDLDLTLLVELVERSLLLCTDAEEAVVFSFLPDPELLMLAHKLGCRCFVAEPDAARCDAALATWKQTGANFQKLSGLRF